MIKYWRGKIADNKQERNFFLTKSSNAAEVSLVLFNSELNLYSIFSQSFI